MAALPLQSSIAQTSTFTKVYRKREMRLGDGYSQRVPDGLNSTYWTCKIDYSPLLAADYATLVSFLDGIGSWGTFDYTPPGAPSSCKFSVDQQSVTITVLAGGNAQLSFTGRQEFDL